MKKTIVLLSLVVMGLAAGGCSLFKEAKLTLEIEEWSTTTEKSGELTFGYINLHIAGSTNCSKVTVLTRGDGVASKEEIEVKDGKFDIVEVIAFTHAAEIGAETETTTVIKGYNGDDTKEIELKSGKLTW